MRNYLRWSCLFAICWWLLLLPKHYHFFSLLNEPVQHVVFPLVNGVFGTHPFFEDSTGMYLLLPVSAMLGLLVGVIAFIPAIRRLSFRPLAAVRTVMLYFLLLELWEYGWIKLVKMQFYLPEPNTVYTPLGWLSKDIAYWSVIGSSRTYVIFLGVTELIAGTLLLIRRTRFLGLLLAAGVFVNVLMVNIAFDISVKLFALTLLAMTTVLLCGYPNQWRYLLQLPVRPRVSVAKPESAWKRWGRALVLSLIVLETVYPSVRSGSLNDDAAPRPAFHGAYAIRDHVQWERLYVHREGYLILENHRGQQLDWKIVSPSNGRLQLLDERTGRKSVMELTRTSNGMTVVWKYGTTTDTLKMNRLVYWSLPLFGKSPHWFSDDYH